MLNDLNNMRFAPAFKDMTDQQYLKAAKCFVVNPEILDIKDGVLYFKNEKTLHE